MARRDQEAFLRSLEYRPARMFVARGRSMGKSGGSAGLTVTAVIAAGQLNPTSASPINFTVTFSKPATGFTNSDVSFSGSTVGGTLAAAVTGTGPYNVAVTGMTGSGAVTISIPSASATDAAGIPFPASNAASVAFVPETTPPTVPTGLTATPTG